MSIQLETLPVVDYTAGAPVEAKLRLAVRCAPRAFVKDDVDHVGLFAVRVTAAQIHVWHPAGASKTGFMSRVSPGYIRFAIEDLNAIGRAYGAPYNLDFATIAHVDAAKTSPEVFALIEGAVARSAYHHEVKMLFYRLSAAVQQAEKQVLDAARKDGRDIQGAALNLREAIETERTAGRIQSARTAYARAALMVEFKLGGLVAVFNEEVVRTHKGKPMTFAEVDAAGEDTVGGER